MQQLQFVELDEGGRLVLVADDGTRFAVPVDDRLRAALRPRPSTGHDRGTGHVSVREVQSLIRAGQSAEEVAATTGWDAARVRRYEGPVLAEREHVVGLAQRAPVRAQGRTDGSHTLGPRVRERLEGRDVDLAGVTWDAARTAAHGPWTVQVIFTAGGRERRAAWHYDAQTRSLETLDDEARWLSEDEQALPGGLAGHPLLGSGHAEDEVAAELMATMRQRRQRRHRRSPRDRGETGTDPGRLPGQEEMPAEVLPLEDLPYDPDTMGDPPAAHPGGAAPESPSPPTTAPEEPEGAVAPEEPGEAAEGGPEPDGQRSGRAARRRLRLPKLPEPVDLPVDSEHADEGQETYAHLRDPGEVTFDEFFDIAEDPDGEPAELVDDDEHAGADLHDEAGEEQDAAPAQAEEAPATADDDDLQVEKVEAAEGPEPEGPEPEEQEPEEPGPQPAPTAPRPGQRASTGRKGRTSVPSWDDIMFGARDRG